VPLVVVAKVAEKPASFRERAVFTPAIAVVEDALDEECLVHALPCCKKRERDVGAVFLRNPSGRC
jgi:hypothetical protein